MGKQTLAPPSSRRNALQELGNEDPPEIAVTDFSQMAFP